MLRQMLRCGRPRAMGAGLLYGPFRTAVCVPGPSARPLHNAPDRSMKGHQVPITLRAKSIPMARGEPITTDIPSALEAFCTAAREPTISTAELDATFEALREALVTQRKSTGADTLDISTQLALAMQACLRLPLEQMIILDSEVDPSRSFLFHAPDRWELARRIYIELTPLLPNGLLPVHGVLFLIASLADRQASIRDHLDVFQELLQDIPDLLHSATAWTVLFYYSLENSTWPRMTKTIWRYMIRLKVEPTPSMIGRLFQLFGFEGKGRHVVALAHSPVVRDLLFPVERADTGLLRDYLSGLETAGLHRHADVPEVAAELHRRMASQTKRKNDVGDVLVTHVGLTQSAEAAIRYAEECQREHGMQPTAATVNRLVLTLIEESLRKRRVITAKQATDLVERIELKLPVRLDDRHLTKLLTAVMGKWGIKSSVDDDGNPTQPEAAEALANSKSWALKAECSNETVLFYSYLAGRGYRPTPLVLLYMMVIALDQMAGASYTGDLETVKMLFAQYCAFLDTPERESVMFDKAVSKAAKDRVGNLRIQRTVSATTARTLPIFVAERLMEAAIETRQWSFAEEVIRFQPHLDQWTTLIDLGRGKFVDYQSAWDDYQERRRNASDKPHFMMDRNKYSKQLIVRMLDFKPQGKLQPMPLNVMVALLKSLRADGQLSNRHLSMLVNYLAKMATKLQHDERSLDTIKDNIKLIHQTFNLMMHRIPDPLIVMTTLMDAYGRCALHHEALDMFNAMLAKDLEPSSATIAVAFDVCGYGSRLPDARRIQTWLERHPKRDTLSNKNTWDAWLECLCRCGAVREAMHVAFFIMPAALELRWQNLQAKREGRASSTEPLTAEQDAAFTSGSHKTKAWPLPHRKMKFHEGRVNPHLLPLSPAGTSERRPDRMTFLILMSFAQGKQGGATYQARDPAVVSELTRNVKRYYPDIWPFLENYTRKALFT